MCWQDAHETPFINLALDVSQKGCGEYGFQNIVVDSGSRLTTRGSTRVSFKRPVLKPPGTDNSAHRQVAEQLRAPVGTANSGRITLFRVIHYLWTAESIGGLVPSAHTWITAERYIECVLANKSKFGGVELPGSANVQTMLNQ